VIFVKMKKLIIVTAVLVCIYALNSYYYNSLHSFPNGAPTGMTGAPGEGGSVCNACHNANLIFQPGMITSDIPPTGFVPGQNYTFTAKINTGDSVYGFSATVQDSFMNTYGTLISGNNSQLFSFNKPGDYITHTQPDYTGEWIFNWTAPLQDTADIAIYASFVASDANQNGKTYKVFTSSLPINSSGTGITSSAQNEIINVFPVPADNFINISLNNKKHEEFILCIFDYSGKMLKYETRNSDSVLSEDVSMLASGTYLLKIKYGNNFFSKKFIIQR
jgi:hypothetical protein